MSIKFLAFFCTFIMRVVNFLEKNIDKFKISFPNYLLIKLYELLFNLGR